MDTRTKIVSVESLEELRRRAKRLKIVTGYFDPLLAAHVRRLGELRRPGETLVVIISEPDRPLLPAAARAELVAALAVVDCVLLAGADLEQLLARLKPDELVREEAADEVRRQQLIRHAHERQRAL